MILQGTGRLSSDLLSSDLESLPEPPIKVVIIYEDFSTAVRAMRLLARVCRDHGHRLPAKTQLWSFEVMEYPDEHSEALEAACAADVLVVAAHARDPLPRQFCSWLEEWAAHRRNRDVALIELLDGSNAHDGESLPAHSIMQSVAKRAGADLFACAVGAPPAPPVNRLSFYTAGVQHWGINE